MRTEKEIREELVRQEHVPEVIRGIRDLVPSISQDLIQRAIETSEMAAKALRWVLEEESFKNDKP